ncbi:MAG: hypothetical protein RMJ89_01965, partial [Flammeovirgaceae bacterium]|nr:hypothetical protein [Flammeovirgaceae bacterium]
MEKHQHTDAHAQESGEKMKKKRLALVEQDPWLEPYEDTLQRWHIHYVNLVKQLESHYGSLYDFAGAHKYLGFNYDKQQAGWYYREW